MKKISNNRLHSSKFLTTFAKNVCIPFYENKIFDRYPIPLLWRPPFSTAAPQPVQHFTALCLAPTDTSLKGLQPTTLLLHVS